MIRTSVNYSIYCDAPEPRRTGCLEMAEDEFRNKGEALKYFRARGWLISRTTDNDRCPSCRKTTAR